MSLVRVLIVDDSGFFRRRLSEIINNDPRLEVVGMANNGQEAIELTKSLKPDVISMDIEMPVLDGISAVRKIMAQNPTPILMLSTWSTQGAKSTLEALEAGAVDYMPKRLNDISVDKNMAHQRLCQCLFDLASSSHGQKFNTSSFPSSQVQTENIKPIDAKQSKQNSIRLIAIGTSTGGPVALQKVLSELPANYPYPILLIQHMPAAFTPSFAERLNTHCNITIKQAEDGESLVPGTAYLAPGGMQMLVKDLKNSLVIKLQAGQENQTYKPSINMTLASLIPICPAETLVIILTGMGSDGRDSCSLLHPLGTTVWAQDEQSSTIYGMPMAIAKAGLADKVLSLSEISRHLVELR